MTNGTKIDGNKLRTWYFQTRNVFGNLLEFQMFVKCAIFKTMYHIF